MNLPVRNFTAISAINTTSDIELNIIQCILRSSLKNDMATGKIIKFAISNMSISKSQ
ncbi:unnamed protein product [Schistosoma curassoni]|uniref:Uncharacterized protein n=2 Tax=Schistosoma TaxID=6181 RepID=A0A183KVG1_9TREM|nr:unnamed protein product [Schistosoma margrebowiei]VDP67912.1 unnamed protein product [Schistosoma curassoni]